jgi:hypothetical protein
LFSECVEKTSVLKTPVPARQAFLAGARLKKRFDFGPWMSFLINHGDDFFTDYRGCQNEFFYLLNRQSQSNLAMFRAPGGQSPP